jgi:hypothetical protein
MNQNYQTHKINRKKKPDTIGHIISENIKNKRIKPRDRFGTWGHGKTIDIVFALMSLNNVKKDYNDGYNTKISKIFIEVLLIISLLPKKHINSIGYERSIEKEDLHTIIEKRLPNIKNPITIDGITKKDTFEFIFNMLQKGDEPLIKERTVHGTDFYTIGNVDEYLKIHMPLHKNLGSIYINDAIISSYNNKMDMIDDIIFSSILHTQKISSELHFTHSNISEIFNMTTYKFKSMLGKYGLCLQEIYREFTNQEILTLNGKTPDSNIDHASLYKPTVFGYDDNSYRMPIGFKIISKENSIDDAIEKINNKFNRDDIKLNNPIKFNLDTLATIVKRIENKKRFDKDGFNKIKKEIAITRNSRFYGNVIDKYNIPFKKSNLFIDSTLSDARLENIGDIVFKTAWSFKIKSENNRKENGIVLSKVSFNKKKNIFKNFFIGKLPEFYNSLTETKINDIVKDFEYKTGGYSFGILYGELGCQLNSDGGADRYNLFVDFKEKLKSSYETIKDTVKELKEKCFDYSKNILPINSETYHFNS